MVRFRHLAIIMITMGFGLLLHELANTAHDVTGGLQAFHDDEFGLRIDFCESTGLMCQCTGLQRGCIHCGSQLRGADNLAKPQRAGRLPCNGQGVARQHLDGDAERPQLVDELAGIGARRIVKKRDSNKH